MTDDARQRLETLTADAGLTMSRLAGGTAVCSFTRAGVAVPGIKYAEGRWAALREVHRGAAADDDVVALATDALARWRGQLDAVEARRAGQDWVAYRTGGVDALDELLGTADVG